MRSRTGFRIVIVLLLLASALVAVWWLAREPARVGEQERPQASRTPGKPAEAGPSLVGEAPPAAPDVISQNPPPQAEVALDGVFEVTFNQPMDETETTAWRVTDAAGDPVAGEISWPKANVLRFRPAASLRPGSRYQVHLMGRSSSGIPLAEEKSVTFQTVGDLAVSQVFPAANAQGVDPDGVITVIFNRPVVPLGFSATAGALPEPLQISPAVAGEGEWVNTAIYVFRPAAPLAGGQTYDARVAAGLEAVDGAPLRQEHAWQFTTVAPGIESVYLPDWMAGPPQELEGVPLDQSFQIRFQQAMDPASTEAAFSLGAQQEPPVSGTFAWNEELTTVTFTPTQRLALDTRYTLALDEAAEARHGGRLAEALRWHFNTVPPPAVTEVVPADGSVQRSFEGMLEIHFASPMARETVTDRVEITPPPAEVTWHFGDRERIAFLYGLAPSTAYEVHLLPGMADLYGNRIEEGRTVRFTTAPYAPFANVELPGLLGLYRAEGAHEVVVSHVNVSTLDFTLTPVAPEEFARLFNGDEPLYDFEPADSPLRQWRLRPTSAPDERRRQTIALAPLEQERLAPGAYFLGLDVPDVSYERRYYQAHLLLVATANVTLKSAPGAVLAWVTDLESGAPLAGVPVTVYDRAFNRLGQASSDGDGLAYLEGLPPVVDWLDRRFVVAGDGGEVFGLAISDVSSGAEPGRFGIMTDYYRRDGRAMAYLYSDRPLYRPGQPVSFKGIVRRDYDLDYRLPAATEAEVAVYNYDGEQVYEVTLPLSGFGSFEDTFTLDEDAALGQYVVQARLPGEEEALGSFTFNVAEYRPPAFRVAVEAGPDNLRLGETFSVTVRADYFSGGPVAGATVQWTVRPATYEFRPEGALSRYSFSPPAEEGYDNLYSGGTFFGPVIAEGEGETGADGTLSLTLPAEASADGGSQQFTVEATVGDVTGSQVSGRDSVVAHRSRLYPGIRPEEYVARAGEEARFEVVAVDWSGRPLAQQPLQVTFVEQRWHLVEEVDTLGQTRWTSTVEEIEVAETSVTTDERGRAGAAFVPPNGGVYQAVVRSRDEAGQESSAATTVWAAGEEFVPWQRTSNQRMDVIVDADSYAPGDTAELLFASPFSGTHYALVTVERGSILYHDVIELADNSAVYELPVTTDMAPNAFVSVVALKGAGATAPDFAHGVAEIKVDAAPYTLDVTVTPQQETVGPGDSVTYAVRVRDYEGRPQRAEVSLALVDLAVLSLSGPNSPSIFDYFYRPQALAVRTATLLGFNVDAFNEAQEGESKGGGGGAGAAGILDVREEFPDTAYWRGQVVTDERGEATVTVTLPDNLTTWRMDARAVTAETLVGQGTVDVATSLPLLLRPQTPRFFVAEDEARLGAVVQNNSEETLAVTATLQVEGATLRGPAAQQVTVPAGAQATVSWPLTVNRDATRVDLLFSASGGGYTDATRPELGTRPGQGIPVYRYQVPETVGTAGQLAEGGARVEAIQLPSSVGTATAGTLTVNLEPSLAAGLAEGLTYLEHFPYECTEQTVSRFLPNVLTTRAVQEAAVEDPALEAGLAQQVNVALQRLYNQQRADGGWGWWPGGESDPLVTAYVVLGLVEARASGYAVDENVLQQGLAAVRGTLQPLGRLEAPYRLNRQAFLLFVLARADAPAVSQTVKLYEARQSLDLYARAFLARTLHLIDAEDPRLEELLSDFGGSAITSGTGTHWEEAERDVWNWNSDTRTTAIVLGALVHLDAENPLLANAVRWLMSQRQGGHWQSTQETAWALMGLADWMAVSGEMEADYAYEVQLNGETLGEGAATAETARSPRQLQADVAALLADTANMLAIGRSDGPGRLYYTVHLSASLPVETVQPVNRGLIVSRSYLDPATGEAVQAADQGELLLARLTLVVPHDLHYVVVDDPLPAGLEAVDRSLQTSQQLDETAAQVWEERTLAGWGWWYFDHVELRDEKVVLSARTLPAGTYEYTYLVRAATPGTFRVIPPTAQEFYFPEVYGRGEGTLFVVKAP